jgi:kumamolisin
VSEQRIEIKGSTPKQLGAEIGPADPTQMLTVTVLLRRAPSAPNIEKELLSGDFQPVARENAAAIMGADPADLAAVRAFLDRYGLKVVGENLAARTIRAQGTVQQMEAAFGAQLLKFKTADGSEFLSHSGPILIPANLSGIIIAVLGLDQRRIAEPRGQQSL